MQSYGRLLDISGQNLKKTIITLQVLRLKLNSLNQTCTSSKSIMQLTKTTFSDSALFIEKETVENWLWAKVNFWGQKDFFSSSGLLLDQGWIIPSSASQATSVVFSRKADGTWPRTTAASHTGRGLWSSSSTSVRSTSHGRDAWCALLHQA